MGGRKRSKRAQRKSAQGPALNPFPGITGPGAEPHTSRGEPSKGVFGDGMDGTLGDVSERRREQRAREQAVGQPELPDMTSGTSISPVSSRYDAPADQFTGGVAVSQGRGSDLGIVKRGMARDPGIEPISSGSAGGSRADDLGMGAGGDLGAEDRQGLSADERATGERGRDTP